MIKKLINSIHRHNAKRELNRYAPKIAEASKHLTPKELVDFVFSDKWARFFWIKQEYSEIFQLCEKVATLRPKTILEIGTAQGGSLFLFSKLADPNAMIISIDLPQGDFGGGYDEYKSDFYRSFATGNQRMHLFRADSHSEETLKKVKDVLGERKIDFMFIDGDHTYNGVKTDFYLYSSLVSTTGLIGLHDIVASTEGCEVHRFWNEIKRNHTVIAEFIDDPNQPFCGIGLLSPVASSK